MLRLFGGRKPFVYSMRSGEVARTGGGLNRNTEHKHDGYRTDNTQKTTAALPTYTSGLGRPAFLTLPADICFAPIKKTVDCGKLFVVVSNNCSIAQGNPVATMEWETLHFHANEIVKPSFRDDKIAFVC